MILPSGNEIEINECSLDESFEIKDIIEKKIEESGISLDGLAVGNVKDMEIDFIIKAALKVDTCKEFREKLFKALARSLHNGEKITKQTFEPIDNRGDYYPVLVEFIKVNIAPFFYHLPSLFAQIIKEKQEKIAKNQTSKSPHQNAI